MADFLYTYPDHRQRQTPAQAMDLLGEDWRMRNLNLERAATETDVPNLTWVELNEEKVDEELYVSLSTLAERVWQSEGVHLLYVTAYNARGGSRDRLLKFLRTAKRPERVELDLVGARDFAVAVARLNAMMSAVGSSAALPACPTSPDATNRHLEPLNADLRSERGTLDAKPICKLFGITQADLAAWVGMKKSTISKTSDGKKLQEVLQPYEGVARMRLLLKDADAFRAWLRTEEPLLEGKSPLHWIKQGKVREIADYVDDALTGQPS